MRVPTACMLVITITACGGGESAKGAPPAGSSAAAAKILESEELCELLQSGLLAEVFAVEAAAVTFEPSNMVKSCTATWPKPDLAEREALVKQKMADWSDAKITAIQKGEEFDQKIPYVATENEVGLTFQPVGGDPDSAVAQLEQGLKQITEGVSVETEDTSATFRINYDEWLDNVGDKAAWASKLKQLSFAADGRIFHLQVKVHDDAAANRDSAVDLANRIIDSL